MNYLGSTNNIRMMYFFCCCIIVLIRKKNTMKTRSTKTRDGFEDECQQILKIILVGDSNVGKTSFLNRFCYGTYKKKVPCTVGLEYGQKVTRIMENKIIVQLWDTAGQEKFKSLTPSFYRSAMAVILMFSADNRDSFNSVTLWMKQICSFADEEIPIILVCNKADLIKKQVSQKQCQSLADYYKREFITISCKENINIEETVIRLFKLVFKGNGLHKKYSNAKLRKANKEKIMCSC